MSADGTALIQLQGIKKVFYTDEVETHALADVHLEIKQGDYVSIAGPSGCGKTTLLSLLGLLDTPTEGTYLLEDRPVANLSAAERARIRNRRIGFIFQAFNLIGDLEDEPDAPVPYSRPLGGGQVRNRSVFEQVGPLRRRVEQAEQGKQRRLPTPRGPRDRDVVALLDLEMHVRERMRLDLVGVEDFLDALELNQRRTVAG